MEKSETLGIICSRNAKLDKNFVHLSNVIFFPLKAATDQYNQT